MTDLPRQGPSTSPDQAPTARPPSYSNKDIVLSLFCAIVVLLAVVVVYFEIAQPLIQGDAPAAAVRQLCADEMRQDYVAV